MNPDRPDASAGGVRIPIQRKKPTFAENLGCLGCVGGSIVLFMVAGLAYFAVFPVVLSVVADAYVTAARSATGGSPRGMAAAGWLLFVVTAAVVLTLVLIRGRVPRPWIYAIGTVLALLALASWMLLPLHGSGLAETVDGRGGSGFITGARWGAMAAVPLLIIAIRVSAGKRAGDFYVKHSMLRWTIGAAGVLAVVALITGVIRAG
ncbi:hypothetical protein [Actinoplanes sp. NPDC026670]|uniref:hypothetical protein n=1 Tax=Actinoplanes sp. NPDC026670 TaxID=3154700 RepID=UPI0033F81D88